MVTKKNPLRTKKVLASFAGVALVAGFLFLDKGITGNVVLNGRAPIDFLSLIGLALVFCSAVLAAYSLKR